MHFRYWKNIILSEEDHLVVDTNLDTPQDLSFYHTLPQEHLVMFVMRRDTYTEGKAMKAEMGTKFKLSRFLK